MIRTKKIRIKGRKEGGAALGALPAPRMHMCAYVNKGMAGSTWLGCVRRQGSAGASAGAGRPISPLRMPFYERKN